MSSKIVSVVGMGGQGKSTLINGAPKHNVTGIVPTLANHGRVIVYDRADVLDGMRFTTAEQLRLYLLADARGKIEGAQVMRLVPTSKRTDEAFATLCAMLRNCWVVVDEAEALAQAQRIPDDLQDAVNYGRNRGIGFVFGSRRYRQVHPDIRTQAQSVIAFRCRDAGKWAAKRERRKINALPEHHAVICGALPNALAPIADNPNLIQV